MLESKDDVKDSLLRYLARRKSDYKTGLPQYRLYFFYNSQSDEKVDFLKAVVEKGLKRKFEPSSCVDADEEVSPGNRAELEAFLEENRASAAVVFCDRLAKKFSLNASSERDGIRIIGAADLESIMSNVEVKRDFWESIRTL